MLLQVIVLQLDKLYKESRYLKLFVDLLWFTLFCYSLMDEPMPEDTRSNVQETDGKGDLQMSDQTREHKPSENAPDGLACQDSADCESAGEVDKSVTAESRQNQAHTANGQKSRQPSSQGPHPVKTTCVAARPTNPKLTLCLSNSPSKVSGTPSDAEMLSPESPVCEIANSSSDFCDGQGVYTEDAGFAKDPAMKSHQVVKDFDSGSLTEEKVCPVATRTEEDDAEMGECSSSSIMSQDLTESQPNAISQRYNFIVCQFVSLRGDVPVIYTDDALYSDPCTLTSCAFCSVPLASCSLDKTWLGTPIDELNRKPQCAPPLSHLKATSNHTVTVRVS